jgi:hypothetical protein
MQVSIIRFFLLGEQFDQESRCGNLRPKASYSNSNIVSKCGGRSGSSNRSVLSILSLPVTHSPFLKRIFISTRIIAQRSFPGYSQLIAIALPYDKNKSSSQQEATKSLIFSLLTITVIFLHVFQKITSDLKQYEQRHPPQLDRPAQTCMMLKSVDILPVMEFRFFPDFQESF